MKLFQLELSGRPYLASEITRIELLGYPNLTQTKETVIEEFLGLVEILPIHHQIANHVIQLRRLTTRLKLPDAIIAATAIEHQCLARDNEDVPSALLWLTETTPTPLFVSNILPDDGKIRERSGDQYNQILSEFHDKMVKPLADELQITVEFTPPEICLEDKLPKSFKLFKNFSRLANKTTGSAYPSDRKRLPLKSSVVAGKFIYWKSL